MVEMTHVWFFLDQSRVFDMIWHDGLAAKLKMCGINGQLLNFLKNYLQNRRVRVVIEGQESEWFNVTAGVPQGSILGPLLFLIYINDIVNTLQAEIHLYADDAVLMCNMNTTPNAVDVLNHDLDELHKWAQKWCMSFNASKTKHMVVTNRYVPLDYAPLQLNSVLLEKVTHFKQLGVYFDEKMTWEAHINHISTIANKKIGLIWKVSLQFPRKCAETIYTNYVRPVLDYGCAVYDNCSRYLTNKLEGVQRNAAVACTRAFRRTPTSSLLTELGWCSLEVRHKYFRLITLYKMIHNRTPSYLRSLLPPRQGQYANRPTRFEHNFCAPRTRGQMYHQSFIPRTVREWNILDEAQKQIPTTSSFKANLKKKTVPNKNAAIL